jgi:hypothetical protein
VLAPEQVTEIMESHSTLWVRRDKDSGIDTRVCDCGTVFRWGTYRFLGEHLEHIAALVSEASEREFTKAEAHAVAVNRQAEHYAAVKRASKVFEWQHIKNRAGQTDRWMNEALDGIVRAALNEEDDRG